ncbi:MAG: G1 family glutamic endopeptidase [Solirubrobacteraceae bacterium]|jgi:hypothetical protein
MRSPRHVAIAFAALVLAVAVAPAGASAAQLPGQVSTNWAGYAVVTGSSTHAFAKRFTTVSGSWTQPTATCVPGQPTFSAFWVGLGGYRQSSQSLEQIGTEADCSPNGTVSYYAWYEYVPDGPHTIHVIPVNAGDTINATVHVVGERATVSLTDATTAATFTYTKVMRSPKPNVGAAEWIAEAPSNCNQNNCTPLALTDFGSVNFTNATATSVGNDGLHTGVIDDPDWIYGAINLQSGPGHFRFSHEVQSSASAGVLAASGDSFSVTYTGGQEPPPGTTGTTGTTGGTGTSGSSGATGIT